MMGNTECEVVEVKPDFGGEKCLLIDHAISMTSIKVEVRSEGNWAEFSLRVLSVLSC